MHNNFTLKDYTELLEYFHKSHEYITFCEYEKKSPDDKIIILRHDIDYSLKQALKVANLEADLGIKSTYFLLFSSPFYNIFEEDNIQIAKQIKDLGHEIGLHYDIGVIEKGNKIDPLSLLNIQINTLSNVISHPIFSIAMHHPSISGKDIFINSNYINAYDETFVKGMAYFSDSCMAWRNKFVEHMELNSFPSRMQLLIHPIWWTENKLDRWEKHKEFVLIRIKEILKEESIAEQLMREHSGVIEHDLRVT